MERHERLRPRASPMLCRYCGKPRPEDSKGKWRTMPAPVDDEGPNRDVPPPLRTVTYCPYHFRAWLPSAHTALTTQVIFSHLVVNAKPIFEVNHTVSICRYCGVKHPGIGGIGRSPIGRRLYLLIAQKIDMSTTHTLCTLEPNRQLGEGDTKLYSIFGLAAAARKKNISFFF